MNIEDLLVRSPTKRRHYSADSIIDVLDGLVGGNRIPARTTMTASYYTTTVSPTVFYTALRPDGTVLTARTTSGVSLSAAGDYVRTQDISGLSTPYEFIAVWDEGNVNDFVLERIVVDT